MNTGNRNIEMKNKDGKTVGKKIADNIRLSLSGMIQIFDPVSDTQIQEAENLILMLLPPELSNLLQYSDGITQLMYLHGEKITIGWILYSLSEVVKNTQIFQTTYHKDGIVFSDDGTGDYFYIMSSGEVRQFHPIDGEDEVIATSLTEFYRNLYPT